ncbi:MAG: efflux RND transporter permease subunit [Planctomycetes bacterium]|nr:efflux RND transporter permease subunit [Planctomycetota bacterium]
MGIIRFAIENPVKVTVGVILAVMFGLLAIFEIPIQLTPDVDRPLITVQTFWEGASPHEVEREIVQPQEEKLKGLRNLKKMTSASSEGSADITLEFTVGTDKDAALQDVSEKLRQVSGYPIEVDEPIIVATGAEMSMTIAWMIFRGPPGQDVAGMKDFIEDDVKPILERAQGIASVDVYGGREREVRVTIDPLQLAARGLTLRDLETALRGQNDNISAGTVTHGKRDFSFRTIGKFERVEDVESTVVAYRDGGPVLVRDVATVENTFKKQYSFVRSKGDFVLALPARRETGANVVQAMESLKEQIALVNREILHPRGQDLSLTQVYDETLYINSSINLVTNNLLIGGAVAVMVLLLFLRSASATGIVAVAIPISVIATFLAVWIIGRSLNVIMLAGMAFAVGMVVDNAIVVLENIYRHRQMGKTPVDAALDGTREVWGAVLASTLTTTAVFLPVVFIEQEAGQLFRDIAIAITCAVLISLVVATTVIPTLAARFLRTERKTRPSSENGGVAGAIASLVHRINGSTAARLTVVVALTLVSVLGSYWLVPATDYLPVGNRNLVFGFLFTPPGYSIDRFKQIAVAIEEGDPNNPHDGIRAHWEAELDSPEEAALAPVTMTVGRGRSTVDVSVKAPPIDNFFFVSFGGGAFMGATSKYDQVVKPLVNVMSDAGERVPGVATFFSQASLFGANLGGGNSIDVEVRGQDLDEVVAVAETLQGQLTERFGFPRPDPANFNLGRPEVRIVPDRERAADVGLDVRDIGFILRACIDGAYVGDFRHKGDEIDLRIHVKDTESASFDEIKNIPIYTPTGAIVPLASCVDFVHTTAPQQIKHIEEMPAVSLTVTPPDGMALETAMNIIEQEVIAPLRESGAIPPTVITALAGTADKLVQTRRALFGSWQGSGLAIDPSTGSRPLFASLGSVFTSRGILALIITYLLMAALFESFIWPFVILFTVPLATVGGFAALGLVHWISLRNPVSPIQQLDVLTMLGFVILLGVVVNNGILVVHQTLNNRRARNLEWRDAITESVRTRVRPIFMTAFTSIGGMLPLVVWPGAGSELYRGLGSVVVGGLLVSTLFTLLLVPTALSLFVDAREMLVRALRGGSESAIPIPAGLPSEPAASSSPPR